MLRKGGRALRGAWLLIGLSALCSIGLLSLSVHPFQAATERFPKTRSLQEILLSGAEPAVEAKLSGGEEACVALLKTLASASTLVALEPASLAWLTTNTSGAMPSPLSLAVVAEDLKELVALVPSDVTLLRTALSSDPRYFDRDPMVHREGVRLPDAHLLLLPPVSACALHVVAIVPRGKDPKGAPSYNWLPSVDLEESSRNILVRQPPRAFSMQNLKPLSLDADKFGSGEGRYNLVGVGDQSLLDWELSFVHRECPFEHAHHFRRAHYNATNEALTRTMKTRLRDGVKRQMARLDGQRLPAFAVAGTLLGWARECDVLSYADIPGNTDVDFAVHHDQTPGQDRLLNVFTADRTQMPVLRRALGHFKAKTFEMRWSYKFEPPLGGPKVGAPPLYKTVAFDLFVLFPNPAGFPNDTAHYSILYTGEKREWFNIHVPVIAREEICSAELDGSLIRVPCDPLGHLEAAYGSQWSEPRQKWAYGGGRKVNFHKAGTWTKDQDTAMIRKY